MGDPLDLVDAWLVVIDPQRIFADQQSEWGSAMFPGILAPIHRLAGAAGRDRTVVTRWVPNGERMGGWIDYFQRWPFADLPPHDPWFDLVPEAADLSGRETVDVPTFGKWGPALAGITGPVPTVVLTGVSTDCCVISTALAAADAGARVIVVADACAGSDPDNHAKALDVMGLYDPQIRVVAADDVIDAWTE